MRTFWLDRPPLFIHRSTDGRKFSGPSFATVDEGDESTVISPLAGEGATGPFTCITMGPFDLAMIGILAQASAALAEREIPIFVISTYRHDHILVPQGKAELAVGALIAAGFTLRGKSD